VGRDPAARNAGAGGEVDLRKTKQSRYWTACRRIILDAFNLEAAERRLCVEALTLAGNIVGAAQILGITRHALKRRIIKLSIDWNRTGAPPSSASASAVT